MKFFTNFINFHHFMMCKTQKINKNNNNHQNDHSAVNAEGVPSKPKNKKRKKRHRNKCDLGDDFESPDGGWGWTLFVASTIHIWITFALVENFKAIYEQHMMELGITSYQIDTMLNIESVLSTFSGLINAPLFRRFSFRQVALMSSTLTSLGFFLCLFANSYSTFVIFYSVIFGFGHGLTISATTVAVVTYFFQLRRTVTAHQFGLVALGSIGFSYFCKFLIANYGLQGAVLILSGISLHNIACSLIYQPVMWHVKSSHNAKSDQEQEIKSNQLTVKTISGHVDLRRASLELEPYVSREHYTATLSHYDDQHNAMQLQQKKDSIQSFEEKHSLLYKIFTFMEFDLLLDLTYVNLAIGMTIVYYDETNFSLWMPDILKDFGFPSYQVNIAISVINWTDIIVRFLIPFITSKTISNKIYFLFGTICMSLGRIVLSFMRGYYGMLMVCVWLGLCKAYRYIHWYIIITDHVPLKRLPAGLGLQFVMTCIFSAAFEPLLHFIRDQTNYTVSLNFMSGLGLLVALSWILEDLWRKYHHQLKMKSGETDA